MQIEKILTDEQLALYLASINSSSNSNINLKIAENYLEWLKRKQNITFSKAEISDEEIDAKSLIFAKEESFTHNEIQRKRNSFIEGAKWYREQLKSKGNGNK